MDAGHRRLERRQAVAAAAIVLVVGTALVALVADRRQRLKDHAFRGSSGRPAPEPKFAFDTYHGRQPRLLPCHFVDLQECTSPWRVSLILPPTDIEVAKALAIRGDEAGHRAWSLTRDNGKSADTGSGCGGASLSARILPCYNGGGPHAHLEILSSRPFRMDGQEVDGIYDVVMLPEGTRVDSCRLEWVSSRLDVPPFADVGPFHALRLVCSVRGSAKMGPSVFCEFWLRFICRCLLLPWPFLLMPLTLWSAVQPMALMAGLMLERGLRHVQRWRRRWRFWLLMRRSDATPLGSVFGEGDPCCVCLGATARAERTSMGDAVIALLPCRHLIHGACYSRWISADTYPALDLICPLCRRQVSTFGRLDP